jgi:hypothetical protein
MRGLAFFLADAPLAFAAEELRVEREHVPVVALLVAEEDALRTAEREQIGLLAAHLQRLARLEASVEAELLDAGAAGSVPLHLDAEAVAVGGHQLPRRSHQVGEVLLSAVLLALLPLLLPLFGGTRRLLRRRLLR